MEFELYNHFAYYAVIIKCRISIIPRACSGFETLAALSKYSIGFSEKRIFPADKSLLMMAMAEMKYVDDVPDIVSIDEAVGLARKYSTEKSVGFVNGVLGTYMTEVQKNGHSD